jgi:putative transposase
MQKSYQIRCPKCNNSSNFYRYGRDALGYQKYQCRNCFHQFAPKRPRSSRVRDIHKYPSCPICGKASFLHHDYQHYSNLRCCDKSCNHSFFVMKPTAVAPTSGSSPSGKADFSGMRYPVHIIIAAIVMFFIGNNSFRKIALIMRILHNVSVSHTTISNWCTRFAPLFQNIALELIPALDFNSDEWHADETVVKVAGVKHYLWFIVDAETRFVLGFHLSPFRNSPQAFSLLKQASTLHGKPAAIVSDRYAAYKQPVKSLGLKHIRVQSFQDDISNNLIEAFNKQFKSWYKTKQGFCSFDSANNLISMFVFFFNFVRPHSGLDGLTPAQVAGLALTASQKRRYPLVA